MASPRPITVSEIGKLLRDNGKVPSAKELQTLLQELISESETRGIELVEVASGYRYQTREQYAPWLAKLWEEKPPNYSKACLETLALIVYRQPITRAGIEEVRGVSVSTSTIRTLEERNWIEIVGYKETPGRPALYATTQVFLDDFNLQSLDDLPDLSSVEDVIQDNPQLASDSVNQSSDTAVINLPTAKPHADKQD